VKQSSSMLNGRPVAAESAISGGSTVVDDIPARYLAELFPPSAVKTRRSQYVCRMRAVFPSLPVVRDAARRGDKSRVDERALTSPVRVRARVSAEVDKHGGRIILVDPGCCRELGDYPVVSVSQRDWRIRSFVKIPGNITVGGFLVSCSEFWRRPTARLRWTALDCCSLGSRALRTNSSRTSASPWAGDLLAAGMDPSIPRRRRNGGVKIRRGQPLQKLRQREDQETRAGRGRGASAACSHTYIFPKTPSEPAGVRTQQHPRARNPEHLFAVHRAASPTYQSPTMTVDIPSLPTTFDRKPRLPCPLAPLPLPPQTVR
jgi:hypothetical protein